MVMPNAVLFMISLDTVVVDAVDIVLLVTYLRLGLFLSSDNCFPFLSISDVGQAEGSNVCIFIDVQSWR